MRIVLNIRIVSYFTLFVYRFKKNNLPQSATHTQGISNGISAVYQIQREFIKPTRFEIEFDIYIQMWTYTFIQLHVLPILSI